MGLLDDLENEAQKRKSTDEETAARKSEREEAYRKVLEPTLEKLHAYLAELIAKLKVLQPKIAVSHAIPGYGDVLAHVEHEYELRTDRQPSARTITVNFNCAIASAECPTVQVEGASRVRAISGLFQRHRLGGPIAPRKDASGEVVGATFKAKGRIPLVATFAADAASGQLRLSFTNFDDLGVVVKSLAPDQIAEDLFDEIGRYLMREPTSFMRENLPENYRSQLRERVQQQEVKRRWEVLIAAHQQEDIALLKREYSISGHFARFGDAVGKLRGLIGKSRD